MSNPFVARVHRVLSATPAQVFAAWTDVDDLKHWFCPADGVTVPAADLDVRVGGRFRIVMRDGETDYEYVGEYLEIVPDTRLRFTWIGPSTKGETSVVTLDFEAKDGGTALHLTHEKLPDEKEAQSFERGWGRIVATLGDHLGT